MGKWPIKESKFGKFHCFMAVIKFTLLLSTKLSSPKHICISIAPLILSTLFFVHYFSHIQFNFSRILLYRIENLLDHMEYIYILVFLKPTETAWMKLFLKIDKTYKVPNQNTLSYEEILRWYTFEYNPAFMFYYNISKWWLDIYFIWKYQVLASRQMIKW